MLDAKKRITLGAPCEKWIETALKLPGLQLIGLEPEISIASTRLPDKFHPDPADRILVATAHARNATLAMKMEFKAATQIKALEPVRAEKEFDYPKVAELCRVIQSDTRTVLVNRELAAKVRMDIPVPSSEIVRHSVQVYPPKIANLGFEPVLFGSKELYVLPESWTYDPECYGYMTEWLALQEIQIAGGYFI
ncbi:MAG: PIN domain-containing protein [Burkholderiales bacterium]